MSNPILDELHATRAKLLREAGGDLHRYVEAARERALASGRSIAQPVQRAARSATVTLPSDISVDKPTPQN